MKSIFITLLFCCLRLHASADGMVLVAPQWNQLPPPCPVGFDTTLTNYNMTECANSIYPYLIEYIIFGAEVGGTWEGFANGTYYNPCTDGNGPFYFTWWDDSGCTIQDTLYFDWAEDPPCDWQLENLCLNEGEGFTFTIPPYPGSGPPFLYEVNYWCVGTYGPYSSESSYTLSYSSIACTCGASCGDNWCVSIGATPIGGGCTWYFGGTFGLGGWYNYVIYGDACCVCSDPPEAGDDSFMSICIDTNPFDLTSVLGGNSDPGGSWNPPLSSGGNIYDPILDGSGTFIYTVSAPDCPDDAAEMNVIVVSLSESLLIESCDDNGTPSDSTDDIILFDFTPIGQFGGMNYTVNISQGSITPVFGSYGETTSFQLQPGSAGNGNVIFTITDNTSPFCDFEFEINDTGHCSMAPPCPSAGEDITVTFCPNNQYVENILIDLNADPGGIWDPPLAYGDNQYTPCIDGEGSFTYTQDNPGCPIEQATITLDWTWDPCDWEPEGLCLTGDEGSFTIPAFVGDHPGSTYTLHSNCVTVMPTTGSLDESTDFTFSWNSWCFTNGCINLWITINEDPSCEYYFGEPDPVDGDYLLCNLPLCNCFDPPYAGEDASISICDDIAPFDLTEALGGNPDADGTWTPPLTSGGNLYDPMLDGSGVFTYTVSSSGCADDQATVTVNVQSIVPAIISGVPAALCETSASIVLSPNQNGIIGNWSGVGVANNMFTPSGLNGIITITFTPEPNQCISPASTTIDIHPFVIVSITGIPDSVCQSAPPVSLPTIQTGVNGNWSGSGVVNNIFNPNGLSGNILLAFTPNASECADPASATIYVSTAIIPSIIGVPDTLCQTDPSVNLPTTQSGITGNWSANGIMNNIFNPAGLNGNIPITFNVDGGQCATNVTFNIHVDVLITPMITNLPSTLCNSAPPLFLQTSQSGILGNWSGQSVVNNEFNPAGLNGNITLTFTPDTGQCAMFTTFNIYVNTEITPDITGVPPSLCETSVAILLPIDQNGITGNWSGIGIINNVFNPLGLSGNIIITYIPVAGQCATNAVTDIIILQPSTPVISGIPSDICETDATIMLPTIQENISGNWSGSGVINNIFNPSGLNGNMVLSFTPVAGQCANGAVTSINVMPPILPVITGIPLALCETADSILLSTIQTGIAGNWSGQGVSNNIFDPSDLNGSVQLTFIPDIGQCAMTVAIPISVNAAPSFQNLMAFCDSLAESYVVSFDIAGGVFGSYLVNGKLFGGSIFVSSAFDADSFDYLFLLDDINGCGPVTISGHLNCACATYAGTMDFSNTPIRICEGELISGIHHGDQNLDPDDLLAFVLHDNAGTQLGMMYGINDSSTFVIPNGISIGQVYYLSCIAGSNNGAGTIDLNDPCLSVSQGVPVIFYTAVQENIISTLCAGESITVNGNLYNKFNPSGTEIFPGASRYGCDSIVYIELSFYVPVISEIRDSLCPGELLVVNGTIYDQSNPTGMVIILNGNSNGCDSTIRVDLNFFPEAEYNLNSLLCYGSSITVNGTIYNESNPMGVEVLSGQGGNGCDSTINISLQFDSIVTYSITSTLCRGDSVVVNNVIYDENHPFGSELMAGASVFGCDSLVEVNLSFFAVSDTTEIALSLCAGEFVMVNGSIYDKQHSSGIEILGGASVHGCDSTIRIDLVYFPDNEVELEYTICEGDSVIINGMIYHGKNLIGPDTLAGVDIHGCDSIIFIEITELMGFTVDAGPDQYLELGQNATLIPDATSPVMQWLWSPPDYLSCSDCDSPEVIQAQHDILYTLEATTSDGCIATDQVKVFVSMKDEIYVPNIFSPNGDGINDIVTLNSNPKIQNVKSLRIFDRWGGVISEIKNFPPNNPNYGWDGTLNGKLLNPGVFVWIAEVEFEGNTVKIFSGEVTLMR